MSLDLSALAIATPSPEELEASVALALGEADVAVTEASASPVDYDFSSVATAGLHRVTGAADVRGARRTWSLFVKTLQHPRHWRHLPALPPELAAEFLQDFPWKAELETRAQVLPVLPTGLRVPDVYNVRDLGHDRIAVWMEDIDVDLTPWTADTYARCAYLLGRLAARRTPEKPAGACSLPTGYALRKLVESRNPEHTASLVDDEIWDHPVVAANLEKDYRHRLGEVLASLPELLDDLDGLPQTLHHGDAAASNLLVPRSEPGSFVAIDWSFNTHLAVGHDLGQLLVGEVQSGAVDPSMLPEIHAVIVPAYCHGLRIEGMQVPQEVVELGYIGALACRSAGSAVPVDLLRTEMTPEVEAFIGRRCRMAQFVLDLIVEQRRKAGAVAVGASADALGEGA